MTFKSQTATTYGEGKGLGITGLRAPGYQGLVAAWMNVSCLLNSIMKSASFG
jgi:hypothetical protein